MPNKASFSQSLKFLMKNHNIKPNCLAEKLNVDQTLVRKWLAGSRVPSLKSGHYESICFHLDLSFRECMLLKSAQVFSLDQNAVYITMVIENYRLLFDLSLDPILLTKPDGRIIAANPAACNFFQMTEHEICNGGRSKITDLEDKNLKRLLNEREKKGKARALVTHIKKDGTKHITEISSATFTNSAGERDAFVVIRALKPV